MRLTHINITMPKGSEDIARSFYVTLLGLREIPNPASLRHRGGIWLDAGGFDLHLSIQAPPLTPDTQRHFGLESPDLQTLRARLTDAAIPIDNGRPAPWNRFFIHDPFGNRIRFRELKP